MYCASNITEISKTFRISLLVIVCIAILFDPIISVYHKGILYCFGY